MHHPDAEAGGIPPFLKKKMLWRTMWRTPVDLKNLVYRQLINQLRENYSYLQLSKVWSNDVQKFHIQHVRANFSPANNGLPNHQTETLQQFPYSIDSWMQWMFRQICRIIHNYSLSWWSSFTVEANVNLVPMCVQAISWYIWSRQQVYISWTFAAFSSNQTQCFYSLCS